MDLLILGLWVVATLLLGGLVWEFCWRGMKKLIGRDKVDNLTENVARLFRSPPLE